MNQQHSVSLNYALGLWSGASTFKWTVSRNGFPEDVYAVEELGKDADNEAAILNLLEHENAVVVAYAFFTLLKMKCKAFLRYCEKYAEDNRVIQIRVDNNVATTSLGEVLLMMRKKFISEIVIDFESSVAQIVRRAKISAMPILEVKRELQRLIDENEFSWNLLPENYKAEIKLMIGKL